MIIVDVRTGEKVAVGDALPNHPGWRLIGIKEKLLTAAAVVQTPGGTREFPLQVRFTHPSFFLQKVGFIPS